MSTCIIHGDMLITLPMLAANSVDAVVTDPPYHLTSVSDRFGSSTAAPAKFGIDGAYARASRGFMGQTWDGGDIAMRPETWAEVLRVLKPGGHMVAFGGSRTYHRIACAIEDAGFEIRDSLMWIYGSGFPKSHDVSKGIDKAAGAVRQVVGRRTDGPSSWMLDQKIEHRANGGTGMGYADGSGKEYDITAPATPEAAQWAGWGTALKPAFEPIILARKPLDGTVAANTLKHGVGGINIDACRIEGVKPLMGDRTQTVVSASSMAGTSTGRTSTGEMTTEGRWPANVLHDGSDEVMAAFAAYGERTSGAMKRNVPGYASEGVTGFLRGRSGPQNQHADSGTAARFFYCAKASKADRAGSKHPTVKPIALMSWLVKLITPPSGTVLDPFAGSGTTLAAASRLGFNVIGIEQSADYVADIYRRMA